MRMRRSLKTWARPAFHEIAVGLEINAYASARA
jgi:coenzyme PQQ precursor peptide PqqA